MLKLFFVIVTLTTLVKSEHAFEWICEDINQMGNCSSLPNFSLLLKKMDDDSKTNKYSNTYYCPYNIVKRSSECIYSYYLSCFDSLTNEEKTFLSMNLPTIDEPSYCITDWAYKKEFREHMACMKKMENAKDELKVSRKQLRQYLEQQINLKYELKNQKNLKSGQAKDIVDQLKCRYFKEYMRLQYMQMRSLCGSSTEKFFRQLFDIMWPLSKIPKNCDSELF